MKFLRNRFIQRSLSTFLILIFVQSIILPNYAFALTSGPHQPEYTSYEEPGATDMVNLLTGDFGFSIPVLEVPGPEGNFSLPLSYHAAIGLEQEASWVGLGWNINVGAIVRDINQYPDDAQGEANTVTVQNLTGVNGYDIQWATPYKQSWNSVTGKYGNVNLLDLVEVEWGSKESVGIMGFRAGDGKAFDAQKFATGVMTVSTLGASSSAAFVKQATVQLAIQSSAALTAAAISGAPKTSGTVGHWNTSSDNRKSLAFSRNPFTGFIGIKNSWKIWLDRTRQEDMYGVLYSHEPNLVAMNTVADIGFGGWAGTKIKINGSLQNPVASFEQSTNTIEKGSASDVNFTINSSSDYESQNNPILLANDQYTVNGPGVSGAISPYRLEVGSVSMPREMTEKHVRLAPVPYMDYKVPFIYEGSATNQYFHHVGGSATPSSPTASYGIPKTAGGTISAWGSTYRFTEFDVQDYSLATERVRTDINSTKKVPQANHIEWMSNLEISSGVTYASKFLDFLPGGPSSARNSFRSNSPNGIGGYCITAPDGQTYHFALPVYTLNETTGSINVADENQNSTIVRSSPFANAWLLTAITGPDFIDRNQNGMADDEDWGYWRKFNYAKHANNYDWRMPYDDNETTIDPSGQFKNYTKGQKQLYYLNSIESRSHVALFMKSTREDGRSALNTGITQLKLDEIALVKKEHYQQLISPTFGLPDYSSGITAMCTTDQITTGMWDYLNKNCLKRVVFTYDYTLCQNTPNATGSNNPLNGKLTLTKVGVKGRNNVSLYPDYKFEYANNPDYDANKWDGWGMYHPSGSTSATSHRTNDPAGTNGSAWSLTKIVTPLGGNLAVGYERDTYASASGQFIFDAPVSFGNFSTFTIPSPSQLVTIEMASTTGFAIDDNVLVDGEVKYKCPGTGVWTTYPYSENYTIQSKTATTVTFNENYSEIISCAQSGSIQIEYNSGTIKKRHTKKIGGNLRVGSIVMQDEFGKENIVRYEYNNEDGTSSGVVAQEPAYIRQSNLTFYDYLNYPQTPVMYGRVSVLKGESENHYFTSKQIFEFQTPNTGHYLQSQQDNGSATNLNDGYLFTLTDRTSQIGRLKSVTLQDENGTEVSKSELQYTEQINNNAGSSYQGVFSEGTVQFELYNPNGKTLIDGGSPNAYWAFLPDKVRINRTTLIRYPYALKKVINTKDGFTSSNENLKWDLISGQVTENISRSALGLNVKSVRVPAYRVSSYGEMGSKALNINNKNMLSQIAAEYVYRSDASGNPLGLISAQAQTWKKDWSNYRYFNGTAYIDNNEQISIDNPIWRTAATYVWKGDYSRVDPALNTANDGTHLFSSADEFNFSAAPTSFWQYTGEILRFDHFGMPLDTKDLNNTYEAVKMGYSDNVQIASASNARFNEIAFSSAEDKIPGQNFFGGEVGFDAATSSVVTTPVHTGYSALSVASAGYGFTFKTSELTIDKSYRASVWSNSTNGRIYYKVNGTEVCPTPVISNAVNVGGVNWYRIDLTIPKGVVTSTTMEIGTKSISGVAVFDDFRFQPADASMTCYVYPPLNYEFSAAGQPAFNYVLGDDNLFTKFEYDDRGVLVKTYSESITFGVKLVSESRNNYRRFHINE